MLVKVDINSLESAIKATKKCLDDYEKEEIKSLKKVK